MKIILVRHGESDWNLEGRVQGQQGGPLNKKGLEQARKAGLWLKNENIVAIYSSDQERARQTALEIAKFHKAPVRCTKTLRESSLGELEGIPLQEYRRIRDKSGLPKHLYKAPGGGENYIDMQKRVKRFLAVLKKKHSKQTVLIVSHKLLTRTLISVLTGTRISDAPEIEQHNAAINVIELNPGQKPKVHYLNSTEHL